MPCEDICIWISSYFFNSPLVVIQSNKQNKTNMQYWLKMKENIRKYIIYNYLNFFQNKGEFIQLIKSVKNSPWLA